MANYSVNKRAVAKARELIVLPPRAHRQRVRRDQGPRCLRVRRLPPATPHGLDRLLLPGRRVGAHRGHARGTQAARVPRPVENVITPMAFRGPVIQWDRGIDRVSSSRLLPPGSAKYTPRPP